MHNQKKKAVQNGKMKITSSYGKTKAKVSENNSCKSKDSSKAFINTMDNQRGRF